MAGPLAVLMMACVALLAAGCAINFFFRLGYRRAFTYSAIFIGAFLLFWASGLWEGASRHYWGVLAPLFALILLGIFLLARFLPPLVDFLWKKFREKSEKS